LFAKEFRRRTVKTAFVVLGAGFGVSPVVTTKECSLMSEFEEMLRNPLSRRAFLARMTAAGLGAAAASLLAAGCGGGGGSNNGSGGFFDRVNFPGIPGNTENQVVLNFALTLETLEADLYRQAVNIAAGKPATTPAPRGNDYSAYSLAVGTGGLSASQAQAGFLYLQQYAAVEAAHRDFLRLAVPRVTGGSPVAANRNGYKADFGGDLKSILGVIRTAEETGVRAYLGAAGFLTDGALLQVASSIYTTEARHSAAINYVLGLDAGPQPQAGDGKVTGTYPHANTFEYFLKPVEVLQAVKPFFA